MNAGSLQTLSNAECNHCILHRILGLHLDSRNALDLSATGGRFRGRRTSVEGVFFWPAADHAGTTTRGISSGRLPPASRVAPVRTIGNRPQGLKAVVHFHFHFHFHFDLLGAALEVLLFHASMVALGIPSLQHTYVTLLRQGKGLLKARLSSRPSPKLMTVSRSIASRSAHSDLTPGFTEPGFTQKELRKLLPKL